MKLKDISCYIKKKKVVVFGTGEYSKVLANQNIEIDYYVDNDTTKWGTLYNNINVFSPETLKTENYADIIVLVASMYYGEISIQLNNYGLIENENYFDALFIVTYKDKSVYEQLVSMENKHLGKRAFIIGNGPSLKIKDLEKIKNEISFASNQVFLSFPETSWRPTYYTVIDTLVAEQNTQEISNVATQKFMCGKSKRFYPMSQDICWLRRLRHKEYINEDLPFSKDLTKGYYNGFSVIYTQLQIAYYMGIQEVYLLGVDFDYKINNIKQDSLDGVINVNGNDLGYFHKNYIKEGQVWRIPKLDEQYKFFEKAKLVYESNNRLIYNASRKTKLDIFDCVNLDNIIPR
ncbi:6-hydroxymethylpterin diphosphokinase MptE-like protein [Alkalihalobacterium sp. APHAB7]|uniref:6-hydroxymethylpterin diphosphokinase MptE-like protein n=1 Tax=Alkalihalobacterium sp. APHAB7 TaxID=3402081 RepID=UPI003AADA396